MLDAPAKSEIRGLRTSLRYRRMRRRILNGEPLCRPCREKGFTVAAAELDHIAPAMRDPSLFWVESNLQPICRSCHETKSAKESAKTAGATLKGDLIATRTTAEAA